MLHYFISFTLWEDGKTKYGMCDDHRDMPITCIEDVHNLAAELADRLGVEPHQVAILSWRRFEEEGS